MAATTLTPPLRTAIHALVAIGRDLLERFQTARRVHTTPHLPRRFVANPHTAERRIARTLGWIVALARTLAGDDFYRETVRLPQLRAIRGPAFTAALRAECGLPPNPPATPEQREAAHLRYIRHVFATEPTGRIARRLARRLGLREQHDAWPADLLHIDQTPAEWADRASAVVDQAGGGASRPASTGGRTAGRPPPVGPRADAGLEVLPPSRASVRCTTGVRGQSP